ncbi:MAG: NAD(P)-dependent oxidoreductase [Deltaproteobacteria bacterium]|nr:NAD(P)-dependent oxidoreductase [Deltaproteobacteria bacterium]
MNVMITGAAGNLGSLLASHMVDYSDLPLVLMRHKRDVKDVFKGHPKIVIRDADLNDKASLVRSLSGVDVIVHFAGVLFRSNPEKFLHQTNTQYFRNLVDAANDCGVEKIILISFPHVEGPTSFASPATGILDGKPISVHATTRLEEEKYLMGNCPQSVILRVGMVYGRGILMVDAARWFATRGLLGIWKEHTEIHLISKIDFCNATQAAIENRDARGIYHIGDDGQITLQEFLNGACEQWQVKKPRVMPLWMIYLAASFFEMRSRIFKTVSPLTKDFIDIGRVSYYGDTSRMKQELLGELTYPTFNDGIETLY